ncbi:class I SAM-dependent methyltransferase [Paenibacillus lignilyticus]|uniref:Class I SAM-dependent methyltransferase n=1 Tax=Paenibacillus lignilyticus TaxID=1172615 RepID=A0ABS5CGI0_9BACL|nr:class I SAM-dependent methyltransferase [Paenibacillus lignilyticus]MBP3964998.1 class I SAM-dependent methyltransferase [Paenibacillus lignilyticus]
MKDNTKRFSDRVEQYVKYRPSYPAAALDFIYEEAALAPATCIIADIGSGTGIFSRLLLERGSTVVAVEPNTEMRLAAEDQLGGHDRYRSVDGSAEATKLGAGSVDCIVSAQAFHWFEPESTRLEFRRILRADGSVALIWNTRLVDDPFGADYDQLLLRYAPDYKDVNHRRLHHEDFASFFRDGSYKKAEFANEQLFDLEGLIGRTLSSSYVPLPGSPSYKPYMEALGALFDKHQQNGIVSFQYRTDIYVGLV